jgi:hypothetical protein
MKIITPSELPQKNFSSPREKNLYLRKNDLPFGVRQGLQKSRPLGAAFGSFLDFYTVNAYGA